jgi:hypothetical protein
MPSLITRSGKVLKRRMIEAANKQWQNPLDVESNDDRENEPKATSKQLHVRFEV